VDPSDLVVREVVRQHKKEDEIDSVRSFFVNVPSTMEYVERSLFIQWKHKHISERLKHVVLKMEAHMGGE
jgi:hypothetical protein